MKKDCGKKYFKYKSVGEFSGNYFYFLTHDLPLPGKRRQAHDKQIKKITLKV